MDNKLLQHYGEFNVTQKLARAEVNEDETGLGTNEKMKLRNEV